jgi:hypothetical protein
MTRFHNGFIEGGTAREKLKHINTWINRLKETQYTPHPFYIVGANFNESNLPSMSKATRQRTSSPD